jgi:N-acyl-D-aspartate/D-glutamate deacylase
MQDRGYLKSGMVADVVVFDPAHFRDTATFDNPHQYATGVRYLFIAGEPVVHEGTPTGSLAGKALRRPNATESLPPK